MQYCSNCGAKNEDNVKFCDNCGTKMENTTKPVVSNAASTPSNNSFSDFLSFRVMISSKLIKIFYIIGVIGIILSSLVVMFSGEDFAFIGGLFMLIFGNLVFRLVCESMIIFFSINDILASMEKELKRK